MNYTKKEMTEDMAKEIIHWRYDPPYDLYNHDHVEESLKEFTNGSYYSVLNEKKQLFGYFCTGEAAKVPKGYDFGVYPEGFTDLGLGMNPEFTGTGIGYSFCSWIIYEIQRERENKSLRLTVARFNERAIHLYKKLGFTEENNFDNGAVKFMTMVKGD